jgi:23S rRNA-/tRNA-specific pseudouridylate synthase
VPTCAAAEALLTAQFKARTVDKRYLALARGVVAPAAGGVLDARLLHVAGERHQSRVHHRGKPARTEWTRPVTGAVFDTPAQWAAP